MGRLCAISVLLLASGMCALVFQTAWLRELKLIFGATTPATAAVIAIFMGGLGAGNAILGPRADRSPNPLQLYALVELAISVLTALSPLSIWLVRALYIAAGGQETFGLAGATVLRILLAALVLGPQVFLMGATLPAAVRAAMSVDDVSRKAVGLLYGMNTIGAVVGALLSTFLLLEWLGTRATLWLACAINLLNAVAAWQLSKSLDQRSQAADQEHASPVPLLSVSEERFVGEVPATLIFAIAFTTGFAFFLMEMVWYRMLGPILGGTTFTFGLILAVALAGIGLGGIIYSLVSGDRRPGLSALGLTLGLEALAIAVPFALGDRLAILAGVLRPLAAIGFGSQIFGWLLVAAIVVLPAAVVSGVQFPLLVALLGAGDREVGAQLGRTLAWNTVGAMTGALAGGFGLMGMLSAVGTWVLTVIVLIASAVVVVAFEFRRIKRLSNLLLALTACAAAAICLAAMGPTAVWRHSGIGARRADIQLTTQNALRDWMNSCRRHIVWEADGRESSVAISTDRGIGFVVNGKSDGSAVQDVGTQVMLGVLGALLHPQPREGLVIGLGTGESAGWLAHQPAIELVDVIEIESAIRNVADVCASLNHDVLRHPKVNIIYNDGREALLTTSRQYDVIASEPSNPYRAGVSSLYTREFYRAVRDRLKPDGLFLQWLQGYEIDVATVVIVLKTLKEAFGHVEIWETSPGDLVLVASAVPPSYTAEQLRRRMEEPAMRDALRIAWRTTKLEGVLSHLVTTDRFVEAVVSQAKEPANTDDRNVLEYRFARTVGQSRGFTVSGLRAEAVKSLMQRPARLERDVDWEAVEDARIAYYAASGDEPLSPTLFAGDRAKRAEALAAFQSQSRLAAVARLWGSQPKPPNDLLETLAVAIGAAAQGEEKAMTTMEPIKGLCPLENDFVIGLLAFKQQRPDDAAGALAIMFKSLRSDAKPLPLVVEHAVRTALEIGSQYPQQIPVLFNSLREPFALRMAEESRTRALCLLASSMGPREIAEAMEQVEPNPWWNARMLEMRVQAYAALKHPLLSRAQAELSQFKSQPGDKSAFLEN